MKGRKAFVQRTTGHTKNWGFSKLKELRLGAEHISYEALVAW